MSLASVVISGSLDGAINAHEVPLTEPEHVALYDRISMVEHNCRANCNKSFTSDGELVSSEYKR
ncbi:unnamed protein product [Plutella xylostella]|uniref:(diamondback moth) hypothetical protein n=1 Tax=Plutella xylostella TaxID=51655 RepID=A0A8S4FPE9_PLUXY|nr:unnamed protein product [Plutella xylostella]